MPPRRASARGSARAATRRTAKPVRVREDVTPEVDDDDDDYVEARDEASIAEESDAESDYANTAALRRKKGGIVGATSSDSDDAEGLAPSMRQNPHRIPTYAEVSRFTRAYRGPLRRGDHPKITSRVIYGDGVALFFAMCERWGGHALPVTSRGDQDGHGGRGSGGKVLASPWLPENFEYDQISAFRAWHGRYRTQWGEIRHWQEPQASSQLSEGEGIEYLPYSRPGESAVYFLPEGHDTTVLLKPGDCLALPTDNTTQKIVQSLRAGGGTKSTAEADSFVFHAGGTVHSMAWAPVASRLDQLLAVAVTPYHGRETTAAHQAPGLGEPLGVPPSAGRGSIQFWSMPLSDTAQSQGAGNGGSHLPKLKLVICLDWGWPKKMAWCPVPLAYDAERDVMQVYGMLAVLTEDGCVRILEVMSTPSAERAYNYIKRPVATLRIENETCGYATCMSWVSINEIALGHGDGSVTLWTIRPQTMIVRVPAHDDLVLDICSAYPSHPYLVASRPVQGLARLIDLRCPSSEHTYYSNPSVGFQDNLMAWSDHMQGFPSTSVTNNPVNGRLDFFPITQYPCPLFLLPHSQSSLPTCLSVGAVHPYMAVGRTDGSVCVVNMMENVFPPLRKSRARMSFNFVLHSERRPPPSHVDGSSLLGAVTMRSVSTLHHNGVALGHLGYKSTVGQAGSRLPGDDGDYIEDDANRGSDDVEPEAESSLLANPFSGQNTMKIYDPLTRVASVAWNPNLDYGTWCAIGLASGLVCIKNLTPQHV